MTTVDEMRGDKVVSGDTITVKDCPTQSQENSTITGLKSALSGELDSICRLKKQLRSYLDVSSSNDGDDEEDDPIILDQSGKEEEVKPYDSEIDQADDDEIEQNDNGAEVLAKKIERARYKRKELENQVLCDHILSDHSTATNQFADRSLPTSPSFKTRSHDNGKVRMNMCNILTNCVVKINNMGGKNTRIVAACLFVALVLSCCFLTNFTSTTNILRNDKPLIMTAQKGMMIWKPYSVNKNPEGFDTYEKNEIGGIPKHCLIKENTTDNMMNSDDTGRVNNGSYDGELDNGELDNSELNNNGMENFLEKNPHLEGYPGKEGRDPSRLATTRLFEEVFEDVLGAEESPVQMYWNFSVYVGRIIQRGISSIVYNKSDSIQNAFRRSDKSIPRLMRFI